MTGVQGLISSLIKRSGAQETNTVEKTAQVTSEQKTPQRERRNTNLAPVLKGGATRSTLSEGYVLLSGGTLVDLEASERFRILRSRVERQVLTKGIKDNVFAVTSAVPDEGKSLVAVNLSRAFGMDPQGKSIIIDCDLRKPNSHRFFSESQSPGLSDVLLAGKSCNAVVRNVEPGLDLLTAGSPVIDSTRVLENPNLEKLITELKAQYRYVILDCPPALLCSEPLTLTKLACGALLVVRCWRTEKRLVKDALQLIGKESFLGVVMNECTDTLQQYGYYGYYGYDKEALARARMKKKQ